MLRPAASFELVAVVFVRSGRGIEPPCLQITGPLRPATRWTPWELHPHRGGSVVRERRPRRSRSGLSGTSNLRFDQYVARNAGGGDPVAAVPDVERLAGTRQAHRRRLPTLLQPHAVALDLGSVETAVTEADVRERDPCRCERRICDTPPFSRSSRVRTGGVEPPQPLATRLQRAELAGARRPQGEARRPVGFEPTLRGSRPRMLAVTSRPPREVEGGIGSPQPGAETLPSDGPGASCCTSRQTCQRRCDAATPSPVGPGGLSAQLHVRARALPSPCSVTSSTRPSTGRSSNSYGAGGIRTHGLELMRLARTAAPLPRVALSRERRSGRQDSNLRSPTPEVGGVADLPYDQSVLAPRQDSNLRREG